MANEKLTKNQRREQGREKARLAREAEKKREKRSKLFLQGGVALGIVVILGVVALILTQTLKPAGPGPENMASGAVTFTEDLAVVATPALQPDETRQARDSNWDELPLDVEVYVDYMCAGCGNFEQTYGSMLETYIGSGDINLSVYPVNFLDSASMGTKYSTRAANLVSCVVEQQPNNAFKLHEQLLSEAGQPKDGASAWTDDQLLEQAEIAGVNVDSALKLCVKEQRFADFVAANAKAVSETGILGLAEGERLLDASGQALQAEDQPQRIVATPTVIVNGKQWQSNRDGALEAYLLKVKSELESGNAGASSSQDSAKDKESE